MKNLTFTAAEVTGYLDLSYGKNTLYKKLRELGFLYADNHPSEEMLKRGLMLVRQPMLVRGKLVNVPIFTWEFLHFIEKYLVKDEAN